MKKYEGDLWIDEQEDGTINIGFIQSFIDRAMNECFHVIQADTQRVDKDGPMLVIETNSSLESIKAPITGHIHFFNQKARNFPDKLKEADVIMTLMPPGVKKKVPATEVEKWPWEQIGIDDFVVLPQQPVRGI